MTSDTSPVDAYLRLFDRVLMLVYYRVPEKAMHRITGTSPTLVKEHLEWRRNTSPTRTPLRTTWSAAASRSTSLLRELSRNPKHPHQQAPSA
ncbi:MAG: hypothetical protein QME70_10015 [Bacillota bacterium]|nr:hypothetical protein [Bacillota bacterium]